MPSGPCVWQAVAGAVYVYRVDGAELGEGLERVVAQVATAFQVGPEFKIGASPTRAFLGHSAHESSAFGLARQEAGGAAIRK